MRNRFSMALLMLFFTSLMASAQQKETISKELLDKSNGLQVANYTPKQAKDGKDGSARMFVLKLFRSANNGKDGKPGYNAPNVTVNVSAVVSGDSTILKLIVNVSGRKNNPDVFYVNPRYGFINVVADGGSGGNGGVGEDGLSKDGKKSATMGGYGGNGGTGGNGGMIEVMIDSSAMAFSKCTCLAYTNRGGSGGMGGNGGGASPNYGEDSTAGPGNAGNPGMNGYNGPPIYIIGANKKAIAVQ